jgi:DNA-binding GntR family transcriptional regulator
MSLPGSFQPPRGSAGPSSEVVTIARPPSLAEHVVQILRDDILAGRLAPGERLTESTIMERTGVSRTPVREGLRSLEAEGLVVSRRGRGSFITYRLSADEAALIYECRLVLEPYLTRLAAERISDSELASLRAVLDRLSSANDRDPQAAGQLDADFHLSLYAASRSELIGVLRGYWSRLQIELSERVYATEVPRRFLTEHVAIFDAVADRDGELAARRMSAHLEHGRAALAAALGGPERKTTP